MTLRELCVQAASYLGRRPLGRVSAAALEARMIHTSHLTSLEHRRNSTQYSNPGRYSPRGGAESSRPSQNMIAASTGGGQRGSRRSENRKDALPLQQLEAQVDQHLNISNASPTQTHETLLRLLNEIKRLNVTSEQPELPLDLAHRIIAELAASDCLTGDGLAEYLDIICKHGPGPYPSQVISMIPNFATKDLRLHYNKTTTHFLYAILYLGTGAAVPTPAYFSRAIDFCTKFRDPHLYAHLKPLIKHYKMADHTLVLESQINFFTALGDNESLNQAAQTYLANNPTPNEHTLLTIAKATSLVEEDPVSFTETLESLSDHTSSLTTLEGLCLLHASLLSRNKLSQATDTLENMKRLYFQVAPVAPIEFDAQDKFMMLFQTAILEHSKVYLEHKMFDAFISLTSDLLHRGFTYSNMYLRTIGNMLSKLDSIDAFKHFQHLFAKCNTLEDTFLDKILLDWNLNHHDNENVLIAAQRILDFYKNSTDKYSLDARNKTNYHAALLALVRLGRFAEAVEATMALNKLTFYLRSTQKESIFQSLAGSPDFMHPLSFFRAFVEGNAPYYWKQVGLLWQIVDRSKGKPDFDRVHSAVVNTLREKGDANRAEQAGKSMLACSSCNTLISRSQIPRAAFCDLCSSVFCNACRNNDACISHGSSFCQTCLHGQQNIY